MNRRTFLIGASATAACSRGPRLNIFNWSDYVAPDTIPNFEREFGLRVRYGTYESIPEMLAKVMSGNSGWDVIFPSAEYIQPMRDMGLLARLNHDWLPEPEQSRPAVPAAAVGSGTRMVGSVHARLDRNRVSEEFWDGSPGAGQICGMRV